MATILSPGPVPINAVAQWDPETQSWAIYDLDTGTVLETGLSEQEAQLVAQEISTGANDAETQALLAAAAEADAVVAEQNQIVDDQDPFEAARVRAEQEYNNQEPEVFGPGDLGVDALPPDELAALEAQQAVNRQTLINEDTLNGQAEQAAKLKAQDQATLAARYKAPSQGDWRVRLVLAANSDYLYKAPPGAALEDDILRPLRQNNGVIFPYTPSISTSYSAYYDKYDLVHSNYRGYFYKSSAVNDINITAIFTAQDTWEAQYLLAVIHFFRSATKMFYGKDLQRGAPPPILYLFGHGQYQFNGHPCVVSNFNYNLPADVDYIRCNAPNNFGTSLLNRLGGNSPTSTLDWLSSTWSRLTNSNLVKGAEPQGGAGSNTGVVPGSVNNTTTSTYVPTKIEISITLLPVQSRAQVSQQFSLKNFANGNLLKGGFW